MRTLFVIAAVASVTLFLVMANNYSIYAQNFTRTWGTLGKGDGQLNGPTGIIQRLWEHSTVRSGRWK